LRRGGSQGCGPGRFARLQLTRREEGRKDTSCEAFVQPKLHVATSHAMDQGPLNLARTRGLQSEGRRRKKKKRRTYLPFLRFFEIFRSDFRKYFYGVFGSSCRETAKNAIKTNRWEKTKGKKFFFLNFFGQKFLTYIFPQKFFYGVFELLLLRNAQKRHKKISKITPKKVPTYPIYHLPGIRRFQFYFSSAPLAPIKTTATARLCLCGSAGAGRPFCFLCICTYVHIIYDLKKKKPSGLRIEHADLIE
jgi:hypothetical protein